MFQGITLGKVLPITLFTHCYSIEVIVSNIIEECEY